MRVEYHKSAFRWIFTLDMSAISSKIKKQMWFTLSTIKSEFGALASAGEEVEWSRDILLEIPLTKDNVSKVFIHYGSQVTLPKAYKRCIT